MTITEKITNIATLITAIRVEMKERKKNILSDRAESFLDDYTTSELKAKIKELTRRKTMLKTIPPAMRGVVHY
jgi:DNA-binding FrmR family transcriptional regulator